MRAGRDDAHGDNESTDDDGTPSHGRCGDNGSSPDVGTTAERPLRIHCELYRRPFTDRRRAVELGLPAVALVDRNTLSGAPRFWKAAREAGIKPLVGAEVVTADGSVVTRPPIFFNRRISSKSSMMGRASL